MTKAEEDYLKDCYEVVEDTVMHIEQCNLEYEFHKKMAKFAKRQKGIAEKRLKNQKDFYESMKKQYSF